MDELPRLRAAAAWNDQRLEPRTPSGSMEEEDALRELDAARADEERELVDTPEARRRRNARYWKRKRP